MKATAATSIAALVAALLATPGIALDLTLNSLNDQHDLNAALDVRAELETWLDFNGTDASSVTPIDASVDGSVEVYEG